MFFGLFTAREQGILFYPRLPVGGKQSEILRHAQGLAHLPGCGLVLWYELHVQSMLVGTDLFNHSTRPGKHVLEPSEIKPRKDHAWVRVDRKGQIDTHIHVLEPVVVGPIFILLPPVPPHNCHSIYIMKK